jgi:hypothetical protein
MSIRHAFRVGRDEDAQAMATLWGLENVKGVHFGSYLYDLYISFCGVFIIDVMD